LFVFDQPDGSFLETITPAFKLQEVAAMEKSMGVALLDSRVYLHANEQHMVKYQLHWMANRMLLADIS
jgi:hypothetical protein